MKNLIVLFLLIGSTAFAGSGSGNVSNVVSFGGATPNLTIPESNSQGYFTINGALTTATDYGPLLNSGVAYKVTTGNSFHATSVCLFATSAGSYAQLVSGTSAISQNATTVTGAVYQAGAAGNYSFALGTANVWQCYNVNYTFASATYAGWQADGVNGIYVIGKETTP